jgi:putative endonuclease
VAAKALSDLLQRLRAAGPRPGQAAEGLACRHLESRGLVVLARNFRCRSGEVDVVARDGETTVFVEVKERAGVSHGEACEAVTFGKRRRIVRAARVYAAARGLSERPLRFDVVAIDWAADGRPRIRHDAAAFDADGR